MITILSHCFFSRRLLLSSSIFVTIIIIHLFLISDTQQFIQSYFVGHSSTTRSQYFGIAGGEAIATHNNDDNLFRGKNFAIEKVSTKARALDVQVFRGISISAREYIMNMQQRNNQFNTNYTITDAIDHLMKGYNENGVYTLIPNQKHISQNFVAIAPTDKNFTRTNNVVGVIQARVQETENYTASSCNKIIYLSNLRVEPSMRQQGIGSALIQQVTDYATELSISDIVLTVEKDNISAQRLYQHHGYKMTGENELDYQMIKNIIL